MQPHSPTGDPSIIVVMGVSGCGKSTIASMLAHRLHWIYEDGDWFHPQSNIEKMHHGEPLTDEDRWPWLHAIAAWIDATRRRLPAFVATLEQSWKTTPISIESPASKSMAHEGICNAMAIAARPCRGPV